MTWFGPAVALLLCLPADASAQNRAPKSWRTTTGRPFAQRIVNDAGIENFAEIAPGIYRGSQPEGAGYRYLKERGVKTVISLREHHDKTKAVAKAGLQPVRIPLHADVTGSAPPAPEQIQSFFSAVLDPKNQPVYFHCALGKDRTGTMAALYRMEVDGWTADEALEEMRAFGAHRIFKSLIKFVKGYKPGRVSLPKGYSSSKASSPAE